jgi:hypothetical protein
VSTLWHADPVGAAERRAAADDVLLSDLPGAKPMTDVVVNCTPVDDGWRCRVTVRDDRGTSEHVVQVGQADAADLAVAIEASHVERLVEETFDFLLERESKESILATFELPVVERYFPGYRDEMRRRLAP